MKFKLILAISLIFVSCSDNSVENEIPENIESVEEIKNFEISINSTDGGTVKIGNEISKKSHNLYRPKDSRLNITAEPNEGYKFIAWTGYRCIKCSWARIAYYGDESSITLDMKYNFTLTANFEKIPEDNSKNIE